MQPLPDSFKHKFLLEMTAWEEKQVGMEEGRIWLSDGWEKEGRGEESWPQHQWIVTIVTGSGSEVVGHCCDSGGGNVAC